MRSFVLRYPYAYRRVAASLLLPLAILVPAAVAIASDTDSCQVTTAGGASLSDSKAVFANQCSGYPRRDCDPSDSGGWICSSEVIGSAAPRVPPDVVAGTPVVDAEHAPTQTPADVSPGDEPSGLCFSAVSRNLDAARSSFSDSCEAFALRDCDPVGGGWRCSSGVIGSSAPGVIATSPDDGADPDEDSALPDVPVAGVVGDDEPPIEVVVTRGDESTAGRRIGRLGVDDLLVLHYDNCPDRDDGHAIAAGYSVVQSTGIGQPLIVNGTCGDGIRHQFIESSRGVMRAVWGDSWLDADAALESSVTTSADAWSAVLANGADVWVAEGGPADFSARVIDRIRQRSPELDLRRVHIVQHSSGRGFNERESQRIATVKRYADYVTISDGNNANNGTADFNEQSSQFVARARASRYGSEWNAAFDYLVPDCSPRSGRCKLDFSDTVELLWIIRDEDTRTVIDFADRYLGP